MDFRLSKYKQLCEELLLAGYNTQTIHSYLLDQDKHSLTCVLRHDVDRSPGDALRMAKLENSLGIQATYYFRATFNVFKPAIIKAIEKMGHEIGFHYETLAQTNGDYERAWDLFQQQLDSFRKVAPVDTISMHGRPLSKWDSRLLWDKYDYRKLGIIGEAYKSIDYKTIRYYNDTGRTWHSSRFNVRDTVKEISHDEIDKTDELIKEIRVKRYPSLIISSHPNRWPQGIFGWSLSIASDAVINAIKLAIINMRKKHKLS